MQCRGRYQDHNIDCEAMQWRFGDCERVGGYEEKEQNFEILR